MTITKVDKPFIVLDQDNEIRAEASESVVAASQLAHQLAARNPAESFRIFRLIATVTSGIQTQITYEDAKP